MGLRFQPRSLLTLSLDVLVMMGFGTVGYFMRAAGLSDITLNVVSLAGLMLALGMLVDNSIVVIESIFRHRNELQEEATTAALRGTSEATVRLRCFPRSLGMMQKVQGLEQPSLTLR